MIKKLQDCPLKDVKLSDGTPVEGVSFRTLATGEMTMCTVMYYKKGAVVPLHHHYNEQVGYVISGKVKVIFDGQESVLEQGDSYALPGNTPHTLEAIEDAELIDVFTPVRKAYLD